MRSRNTTATPPCDSIIWTILFLLLVAGGIFVQIVTTRAYEIEAYENRI